MERVKSEDIQKALEVLRSGGVILYPTDTIWGIGCDATNEEAIEKIFKIKGRSKEKGMIVLLENENQLASYVNDIPEIAYDLIEYTEKPLTIIYDKGKNVASNLLTSDGSIAVRLVKHPFCSELLKKFRKPLVSTSANLSGQNSPKHFSDIDESILEAVDYVVEFDQHNLNSNPPSTIMKLDNSGKFEFIRK